MRKTSKQLVPATILMALAGAAILTLVAGCAGTQATGGEQMLNISGESYPIQRIGLSKDYDFWIYKIRGIDRSSKQKKRIGLKGNEVETISRTVGFVLVDDSGYQWDGVGLVDMEKAKKAGESRSQARIASYRYRVRMDEKTTGVTRHLDTYYDPGAPDFDGSIRGTITDELNTVLYTFESNPRLDTYPEPGKGLAVVSIYKNETAVCVLDRRNGYEVTFFEGFQPTDRTMMAAVVTALFTLMEYGTL